MILSPLQYFQVLQPQPLFYSGLRARLKSILLSECSSSVEVGAPLRPNYLVQYWVGRGRGRGRGRRTWWGESVGGKPSRYCHIELLFGEWYLMWINYTLLFISTAGALVGITVKGVSTPLTHSTQHFAQKPHKAK